METTRIIEQYLDNTLSREDRILVESKAASDKNFRELINLFKEVNESISDNELFQLKQQLRNIVEEEPGIVTTRNMRTVKPRRWLRIAALILMVAGLAVVIRFIVFNNVNTLNLFGRYYEPYEADIVSRTADSDMNVLMNAIQFYNSRDYSAALSVLEGIVADNGENYPAWFFKGLVYMELDAMPEAIHSFNQIPESWQGVYREHVDWYYALAVLHEGDVNNAAERLGKISANRGYYAGKGKKILVRLGN